MPLCPHYNYYTLSFLFHYGIDSVYDPRCIEIQHHDGVRFAAIINHNGEKIAGGFTEGVNPYEGDEAKLHEFYKFALTYISKN